MILCLEHHLSSIESICGALLVSMLIVISPLVIFSQTPSSIKLEEMKKLDFLVGKWKGTGWLYLHDGIREEFSHKSGVKAESDGTALSFTNNQYLKGSDTTYFELPQSFIINYDEGAKSYRLRPASAEGRLFAGQSAKGPLSAKIIAPKTFQAILPMGAVSFRITVRVTDEGERQDLWETWMSDKEGWRKWQESTL